MTLAVWVRPETTAGLQSVIVKWAQGDADAYGMWLHDGVLVAAVGVPGTPQFGTYAGRVPAGSWSHVAMTYRSTTGALALYVNGVHVGGSTVLGAITGSDAPLQIGHEQSFEQRYFTGAIDDAQVYATALTAEDMAGIATAAAEGMCSGAGSGTGARTAPRRTLRATATAPLSGSSATPPEQPAPASPSTAGATYGSAARRR